MKNLLLVLVFILVQAGLTTAQTQKGFNFQGYARNADGGPITNQSVNVKFTIYPQGNPGSPDFEETQVTTTDAYGVFQLVVGAVGTTQFKALKFDQKNYWLKVEVKTGSSNFVEINNTELLAVPYARAADNGVPPGTVLPFAGPKSKVPVGFLACDGTSYNTADYPVLFDVIGIGWGGGGAQFKVPDLRGMFLRGVSETAGTDDDKTTRAAISTGGNAGNEVGSVQSEGFRSHNHTGTTSTDGSHSHTWLWGTEGDDSGSGGSNAEYTRAGGSVTDAIGSAGDHNHTFTTSSNGGNETRPDNAYVYFIIKY